MKKTLVFIAIAMAAGVCAAQEVSVGGAVANVLLIDNKGSAVELAYNHQIIPHLYATARFSSYDVAGDVVSFMGNDFAPSVIGKSFEVGPMAGWKVSDALDFRVAVMAGVDHRIVTEIGSADILLPDGTLTGRTYYYTARDVAFRWDLAASVGWWFTERVCMELYGNVKMPYLLGSEYRVGLSLSFKL